MKLSITLTQQVQSGGDVLIPPQFLEEVKEYLDSNPIRTLHDIDKIPCRNETGEINEAMDWLMSKLLRIKECEYDWELNDFEYEIKPE